MNRTMYRIGLAMALIVTFAAAVAQATEVTRGNVTEVTVYRDQALITRTIEVEGPKGPLGIVVTDLPDKIIPASLSAESKGNSRIHSVTYRTKAITGETRPEVKAIDEKIAELEKQLRELNAYQELLQVKHKIIGKLEEFTASTAKMELQKGVLNFEELRQLTEYGLGKHDEFLQESLKLQEKNEETLKQIDLLKRKRSELAAGYSQTQREALVYLTKDTDQPVTISLRYLVGQVGWYPQYNLRSDEERSSVSVEYNAIIKQMSGEDWTSVGLTLSTTQPTFTAEPPVIEPLEITLGPKKVLKEEEVEKTLEGFQQRRFAEQKAAAPPPERSSMLNVFAGEEQLLELTQKVDVLMAAKKKIMRIEGVSVTYQLPHLVNLASRTDEQILQIAAVSMPARFTHIAAPVLTDFVYEETSATNTTPYVFLPGSYNAYLNGEFVGRGRIELIASGEEFRAGFGTDPQVQVVKELVTKSEHIEGGNMVSEFEYKLTVSNYGKKVMRLKLEDRMPYSPDGSVQVKLLEATPKISQDPEYQRTKLKKGLLRWNLEIPEQAINEKAIVVMYRFRMAHDKQMTIKGLFESR